ncbi:hypothetical protein [Streptomyces oceani]|uniref:Secreted protein n=1 Tax=Streptomyces oceani TaxID=1075402 RepID=A0A1E7KL78_9ACTN|nr:hypothetical protein [Streptomyces oceani]OEV04792.1 hypothetical protein AN216_05845 [Streptomyces oceani]
MNLRRTMKSRSAMAAVVITATTALMVSGCGGGDDGEDEPNADSSSGQSEQNSSGGGDDNKSEDGGVLAEVTGGEDITLTIKSATRKAGNFVTVSGSVKNGGDGLWAAPGWQGDESELNKNGASMAGAKITDGKGKKRYYILRDTDGRCLCTSFPRGIQPGESKTWYAQFPAPPEGNNKVDFQIADMPPASITISEG